jgi:hypothetical protein
VSGARFRFYPLIGFGVDIHISNEDVDGRPQCLSLKYARQNFGFICFLPGTHQLRDAWPPAIQLFLNIFLAQGHSGRDTLDGYAYGNVVRLAERGHAENFTKGVPTHPFHRFENSPLAL